MVKLQKRFAYRYKGREGDKEHYKYVVTIPAEVVEKLGWNEGEKLEPIKQGELLIIRKVRQ